MYIPHTDNEREEMLKTIGVGNIKDLFTCLPASDCFPKLSLPPALTEMEIKSLVQDISFANETVEDLICFLGAGSYNHYIPATVSAITQRGEFLTAYTPYQPELSQGTLQVIFEYQTLISNLTGMEVSNASHYDGATAVAEAGIQAFHHFRGKRSKIAVSPSVHPHYRKTLKTYLSGFSNLSISDDKDSPDIFMEPDDLGSVIDQDTALVVVQYPDFFGRVFDLTSLSKTVHESGSLLAVVVNPIALGLLKTPGDFDADFAVGEGQPLGIPLSFGGPYLGFFTTRKEFIRKISGRLVGETVDSQGRKGYVLTLTAREQHIRREKSSSNICSNQGLMALAATVYLSTLGKNGLKQVANLCYQKAHYAAEKITSIPGFSLTYNSTFFNEFLIKCPMPVEEINLQLLDHGILGGYDISNDYPGHENEMLIAVTEMNTREDIDLLANVLQEVSNA